MFSPRRKPRSAVRPQQEVELDPVAMALAIWLSLMVLTAIIMQAKTLGTSPPPSVIDAPITYMTWM